MNVNRATWRSTLPISAAEDCQIRAGERMLVVQNPTLHAGTPGETAAAEVQHG